ncbi:MAG: L7Ae/L30e/S12e/Gadd45 family ribosomal protein [Aristaeellaceae bacterium]
MNEQQLNRLRGLMGLCVRARQAVFGEDGCMKTIRAGNCGVLLLDEGASQATQEKYAGVCRHADTPIERLPEGLLHAATGKPGVAMAVLKGGLANQMRQQLSGPAESTGIRKMKPTKSPKHSGGASVE